MIATRAHLVLAKKSRMRFRLRCVLCFPVCGKLNTTRSNKTRFFSCPCPSLSSPSPPPSFPSKVSSSLVASTEWTTCPAIRFASEKKRERKRNVGGGISASADTKIMGVNTSSRTVVGGVKPLRTLGRQPLCTCLVYPPTGSLLQRPTEIWVWPFAACSSKDEDVQTPTRARPNTIKVTMDPGVTPLQQTPTVKYQSSSKRRLPVY